MLGSVRKFISKCKGMALSNSKEPCMAKKKRRPPTFRVVENKVGTGWHVEVIYEDRVPEQVSGFQSEAEVEEWIRNRRGIRRRKTK
jgi:hypothetical protein